MRCRHTVCALIAALLLSGCGTTKPIAGSPDMNAALLTRSQGYALLYSTVDDESGLDGVLLLRNPRPQVVELIKAIAEFARTAKKRLEIAAREDATIDLKNQGLPEIESKTRSSISSATGKQILTSGGKDLEFNLLMTQHEALNYITHLAEVLAKEDSNDASRHYFAQLAKDSDALHERVIGLLKAPYVGPGK